MIKTDESEHSVRILCKTYRMSPSSYYRWKDQKGKTAREREDEVLSSAIQSSWKRSRKNYGSPRIEKDLRKDGIGTSRKRVARLMNAAGIEGRYNRRKKPLVTDSRHGHRISENKLKSTPFPTGLRQVIVTDTTYIWTEEGWYYLATVRWNLNPHDRPRYRMARETSAKKLLPLAQSNQRVGLEAPPHVIERTTGRD